MKFVSRADKIFYKLERERQWIRQHHRCYYCRESISRDELTFDHVIPLSKTSNLHSFKNCVVACQDCNQRKSANTDWSLNKSLDVYEKMIKDALDRLEERIKLTEYRLSDNNRGSFSKWKRYHHKNGKWS